MSGNDLIVWLHGVVIITSVIAAAQLWLGRTTAAAVALDPALQLAPEPCIPAPTKPAAAPGRLQAADHLHRVADVVEKHRRRVVEMASAQRDAARHLDAAEVALTRLLREVGAVSGIGRTSALA